MRLIAVASLVLLGLLGGCPRPSGGGPSGECFVDEECAAGDVCARDSQCWPESEVRHVRTTWTLRGQPASDTTCARHPDLHIVFVGRATTDLGFSPVPCATGQFVVDKLPLAFTRVELGVDNGGPWTAGAISSSDTATLDLALDLTF